MTSAAAATDAQHTGHLLLATAFVLVALLAVGLAERVNLRPGRTSRPVLVVAASGAAGGAIHLAVAPSHGAQASVYGAFFVVAGTTQLAWAGLLLVRSSRGLLGLNVLANLGLLLLWLQTRTRGVPLGPAAGVREPVGAVDLACALVELLTVVVAAQQLRHRSRARRLVPSRA